MLSLLSWIDWELCTAAGAQASNVLLCAAGEQVEGSSIRIPFSLRVQEAPEAPILDDAPITEGPPPTPQADGQAAAQAPVVAEPLETPAPEGVTAPKQGALSADSSVDAHVPGVGDDAEAAGVNVFSNPLFSARRPL